MPWGTARASLQPGARHVQPPWGESRWGNGYSYYCLQLLQTGFRMLQDLPNKWMQSFMKVVWSRSTGLVNSTKFCREQKCFDGFNGIKDYVNLFTLDFADNHKLLNVYWNQSTCPSPVLLESWPSATALQFLVHEEKWQCLCCSFLVLAKGKYQGSDGLKGRSWDSSHLSWGWCDIPTSWCSWLWLPSSAGIKLAE